MSRSNQRIQQLADIRNLRALSEQVAEARAMRSARASGEQETRCRQEDELLEAALGEWHMALSAQRFDPVTAAIFSRGVDQRDRTRAQAYQDLAALTADLDDARRECSRAQAAHRCAAALLDQARRRHLRLREEKVLAARDDSNAGRLAAR